MQSVGSDFLHSEAGGLVYCAEETEEGSKLQRRNKVERVLEKI